MRATHNVNASFNDRLPRREMQGMSFFMYNFRYSISFDDVDAAGIVYYPRYFHFCHLALETMFNEKGPYKYPELIFKKRLGLPIVHVEANFQKPLFYGDIVTISVSIKHIGKSSLVTNYRFNKENDDEDYFSTDITTVCIDIDRKQSTTLPDDLRIFFDGLKAGS